jgi:hypothetical protein
LVKIRRVQMYPRKSTPCSYGSKLSPKNALKTPCHWSFHTKKN